jgi:hypothetical protein
VYWIEREFFLTILFSLPLDPFLDPPLLGMTHMPSHMHLLGHVSHTRDFLCVTSVTPDARIYRTRIIIMMSPHLTKGVPRLYNIHILLMHAHTLPKFKWRVNCQALLFQLCFWEEFSTLSDGRFLLLHPKKNVIGHRLRLFFPSE